MFSFPFQILGSEDSQDLDIMVFQETLPEKIELAADLCRQYALELEWILKSDKKINVNLGVLGKGVLVNVFKGLYDETNNALYYTWALHPQHFPNHIQHPLERNIQAKIQRSIRVVLSLLTKTSQRQLIKQALRLEWEEKIQRLPEIPFRFLLEREMDKISERMTIPDCQKMIAFQLGQSLALIEGKELYTKSDISAYFPRLRGYLLREEGLDSGILADYCELLVHKAINF